MEALRIVHVAALSLDMTVDAVILEIEARIAFSDPQLFDGKRDIAIVASEQLPRRGRYCVERLQC